MTRTLDPYGLTAARAHGRPGRELRPASMTIDMHSHVGVPEAAALVAPHLDLSTVPLAHFANAQTKAINRQQEVDRAPCFTDLAVRLGHMDAMGVDMQVVMPPPPQCYYTVTPELGAKAARIVNDGIAEFVSRKPDRFVALGTVPMQDSAAAMAELERCMSTLGFRGVQVLTNVAGNELSDPAYAPFWAKAEELGAVVLLHPNGFTQGERLTRFYFNNVVGNPLETTLALHYLIFDGVLERHPKLKIIAVHGGGYLASYSGRIDHVWGAREDGNAGLPHPPTTYLKRVWFDTVVFTPHQLDNLIRVFGPERLMMGTDYPFDMGEYDPVGHVASVPGITPETMAALCGGNARALFSV